MVYIKIETQKTVTDMQQAFNDACSNGDLTTAQELFRTGHVDLHDQIDAPFLLACKGNHLHVVQWLFDTCQGAVFTAQPKLCGMTYTSLCTQGHLSLAKWFRTACSIHLRDADDVSALYGAIHAEHLDVAQWLVSVRAAAGFAPNKGDVSFYHMCTDGKLEMAQWMYSVGFRNESAFLGACFYNRLQVVKWLWSVDHIVRPWLPSAYESSCERGFTELAQWLWSMIGPKLGSVHAGGNAAFKAAVARKHVQTALWLESLHTPKDWTDPSIQHCFSFCQDQRWIGLRCAWIWSCVSRNNFR